MKTAGVPMKNFLARNNYALKFDGATNYAQAVVAAPFTYPSGWFECFVSMLTISNTEMEIVSNYGGVGEDGGWLWAVQPDGSVNCRGNGIWTRTTPAGLVTVNKPVHLAFTVSSGPTGQVRWFVNGAQVDAAPNAFKYRHTNYFFGRASHAAVSWANCIIDGARSYSREPAPGEVSEHSKGIFRDETGLLGRWEFDEGSGATAYDWSGNGNDAVLTAGPAYVAGLTPPRSPFFPVADLYTFTLANGAGVLRYTPFDKDLTIGGVTWKTGGPLIKRSAIKMAVGIDVKTMDLEITPRTTDLVNGVPWLVALKRGAFDGCYVLLERTAMPTPGFTGLGKYWKFSGYLADSEADRAVMKTTVRSREEVLNRLFPANIFQPGCRRVLFDSLCTLAKAAFRSPTAAAAGSTASVLNCGLAQAAGHFTQGTVTMTSGANNGISRTVKAYTPGVLTLSRPLPNVAAPGDTFDAYPGCDKQQATCTNKFNNLANFSAESYLPAPETAA